MIRVWSALVCLLSLAICVQCLDLGRLKVFPENGRISGVFMVYLESKPQVYSFNASVAREACQSLNVNIATKGQVETAQKNGLQTCRYGWVAENFAVVPRTVRSERCGQNKLGVITWQAEPSKAFEVFCFNATDLAKQIETTSSSVLSTKPSGKSVSTEPPRETAVSPLLLSTMSFRLPLSPSTPTPFMSTVLNPFSTVVSSSLSTSVASLYSTQSSDILSSTSTLSLTSTYTSTSTFTSTSTSTSTQSSLSTSPPQTMSLYTGNPVQPQTVSSPESSSKAVLTALIISASVVLLLAAGAAGAIWYYKIRGRSFPLWTRIRNKEIIETEMWRHFSKRHQNSQQRSREDDTKSYDDITVQMDLD